MRGHLAGFGLAAPKGPVPAPVQDMGPLFLQQIDQLTFIITGLANEPEAATKTDCALRRLCPVHGIGPVTRGRHRGFCP